MKRISLIIVICMASLAMALPSQARILRVGPRVGVDVSSLHFNQDLLSDQNRTGFTGGLQAEIGLPFGFAADGSLMYVRRTIAAEFRASDNSNVELGRDFINIPLNIKWKLGLPAIEKVFTPYVFTGPDFAFLLSKDRNLIEDIKCRRTEVSWNFGLGIELVEHLQLSATYGLGLTGLKNLSESMSDLKGANNNWTITAAYLF